MQAFAYSNSPWPIRSDIAESFRFTWEKFAEPGTWLSGEQRLQIAQEVRNATTCKLCKSRKDALSPFSIDGEHDGDHTSLSPVLVDIAHRLTTDAARLTPAWLEQNVSEGVSKEAYVEALSVVVSILAIDAFHNTLGFELEVLPAAKSGEPSGYRPPVATLQGAWVPMLSLKDVTKDDADIYEGMPRTANVIAAMSIVPDAVRLLHKQSDAMYLPGNEVINPAANGGRALSRPQIELIAGRVSALNQCFY